MIATEAPAATGEPADPCTPGSRLVRLAPDGGRRVLTDGFGAACDPALDFDAGRLFFTGRRGDSGPLRVWQMDLTAADPTFEPISDAGRSCRHPAPLPSGGAVYECGGELWRRLDPPDGTAAAVEERLTSSLGRMRAPAMLPDGRIVAVLGPPRGGDSPGSRVVVSLPDGTWLTPWRDAPVPGLAEARPAAPDHLLLTSGASADGTGGSTIRVGSLADPFQPLRTLHFAIGGSGRRGDLQDLRDPAPWPAGGLIASGRPGPDLSYELVLLDAAPDGGEPSAAPGPTIPLAAGDGGAHLLQPVAVAPVERPMAIPSIVKADRRSGFLVLFDAARTDDPEVAAALSGPPAAVRVYPFEEGPESPRAMDVAPAEDGSVHLQVEADRPLGIALVGSDGRVVARRSEPTWVRPNERRACLGCHVSARYAPPNRRPLALLDPAVRINLPEDEPGQGGEDKGR